VIRDAVLLDQGNEVRRRIAGQGGLGKVWIRTKKSFWTAMDVGEVAAAAAGDENFLAQAIGAFEYRDATSASTSLDGAHQAGGASTKNQCVEGVGRHLQIGSHVEQAKARNAMLFQQPFVDVLLLQLLDLCRRHFAPVGYEVVVGFGADIYDLFIGSRG
jgi:hypothetical protein